MSQDQHSSIALPCQSGCGASALTATPDLDRGAAGHPLAARHGAAALVSGFTAIPNVVFDHSGALGLSPGELAFAERVTRYQHDRRAPFPAERTISVQMGRSTRQIRNYIASLRRKGFLRVQPRFCPASGRQTSNAYDFTPLIEAAVAAATAPLSPLTATSTGDMVAPATAMPGCVLRPTTDFHLTRQEISALEEETLEKAITIRSPLTPASRTEDSMRQSGRGAIDAAPLAHAFSLVAGTHGSDGNTDAEVVEGSLPETEALLTRLTALGRVFGDRCPAASVTRAGNLLRRAGLSMQDFLRALDEAARRTLIASRRRNAPRPRQGKLMAYLFAVLENLLSQPEESPPQPSSSRCKVRPAPAEPTALVAPPDETAGRQPVVEEHPMWRAVLHELRDTMTPDNFARCARAHVVSQDGTLLYLAVPDTFHLHWLERLRHRIEGALATTGHVGVGVAFRLAEHSR